MIASELLPWYTNSILVGPQKVTLTQSALQAATFVELALLFVAAAIVALVVLRAGSGDLHLPASDGTLFTVAGAWSCVLIVYRMFDRPEQVVDTISLTLGLDWGIFFAFVAAATVVAAGLRSRSRRKQRR